MNLFCVHLLAELIVVRPEESDLLEKNLIFLCQQVYPFSIVVDFFRVVGGTGATFFEKVDVISGFLA